MILENEIQVGKKTKSFLISLFCLGFLFLLVGKAQAFPYNPAVSYSGGSEPRAIFSADVNGDSYQDLIVANNLADNFSVFINDGDGSFALPVNYTTCVFPQAIFATDFDSDGDQDLAVMNVGEIYIHKNNGSGVFAAGVSYGSFLNSWDIFVADFDGDSDQDLVVTEMDANRVSVLKNNGNATFAAAVTYTVGSEPTGVFAADLDGDSDKDLVVTNYSSSNISVLKNNGNATFVAAVNYSVGDVLFELTISDFDGDGDRDLAVINSTDVFILKNNNDATFAAAVSFPVDSIGGGVYAIFSSDFDLDGDQDLSTAIQSDSSVSVLINNGAGTFALGDNYSVSGLVPSGVYGADFDNDSDIDLATSNQNDNTVSVFLSQAAQPGVTVSTISGNTTEAAGTATFTVVLDILPTGNVVVESVTDDATEGTVTSGASLTFTTLNWNTPQTVTVTGVDDATNDGDVVYNILVTVNAVTTADISYDVINPNDVAVTNTNNDTARGSRYYGDSSVVSTTPVVNLGAPIGGETWFGGEVKDITWTTTGNGIDTVGIYYSANNGLVYNQVAYNILNSLGTYAWTLPNLDSETVLVKIIAYDSGKGNLDTDVSDIVSITSFDDGSCVDCDSGADLTPEGYIYEDSEGRIVAIESGLFGPSPVDGQEEEISKIFIGQFIRSYYYNTIYYIDENLVRHPFWDSNSFFTYADSFDEVVWVTDATLPTMTLGTPMLPKAGVVLVKITPDAKTYAIDSGDTLRWVPSEAVATTLYGSTWPDYVIDLESTIFARFTVGDDMTTSDLVDRSLMKTRTELVDMAR